jgi:S-formylglutathione hydrolase FrmB
MHGWVPAVGQILAVGVLGLAVSLRSRRWYQVWLASAGAVGLLAAGTAHWLLEDLGITSEPAPARLWLWVAVSGMATATIVIGWRGSHWFRRNLTVFAASVCLLSTGVTVNGWIGYFPTVSAAWSQLTGAPLPDQTDLATVRAMQRAGARPVTGALIPVTISGAASQFSHRVEWVYLPPAWFSSSPPPALPAVLMIAGEFHTPADWVRIGDAIATLDAFASSHGGHAPVAVFVDSGGSFANDTECVNGVRGNAADHLTEDVVPFVAATFGTSQDRTHWGVAGFSSGGTCALNLAVMHPELFGAFVDIAGDRGPNAGSRTQTIDRLFGGDVSAWAAFDPTTVMNRHGPYANLSGIFVAPGSGGAHGSGSEAGSLCATARSHDVSCEVVTLAGRHDWPFAGSAFRDALPWLASRLGTRGVDHALGPPLSTGGPGAAGAASTVAIG